MKEHYEQSALYIAYYQQRVSKNQHLATFVEKLSPKVLSQSSCFKVLYERSNLQLLS